MALWVLELAKFAVLIGGGIVVQQLIRRYGAAYAAEAFRDTPRAGPAFVALADIAYYLLVVAYALFNVRVAAGKPADAPATGEDVQIAIYSVAGLALIIGLLHGLNVLILPGMGRLLARRARDPHSAAPPHAVAESQ